MSEFEGLIRQYQQRVVQAVEEILDGSFKTLNFEVYGDVLLRDPETRRRIMPEIWTSQMERYRAMHREADSLEERAGSYEGAVAESFRNLAAEIRQGIPKTSYLQRVQELDNRVGRLGYIVVYSAAGSMTLGMDQSAIPKMARERNRQSAAAGIREICQEQWDECNIEELIARVSEIRETYLYDAVARDRSYEGLGRLGNLK